MINKGILFIISGPSGVGKTTIERHLKENLKLFVSISETTRLRRDNEENGVDYVFRTENEFNEGVSESRYLEWASVHGNLYGTPADPIEKRIKEGINCLLVIDVQGARQIKKRLPSSVMVFLSPPSIDELRKRLSNRTTENPETITHRLDNAQNEIDFSLIYDYSVVNHNIEQAVDDVTKIIHNCRVRRSHD